MGIAKRIVARKTPRLAVSFAHLSLDNPLIPASGCYGFGYERADVLDPDFFGSIALKGTTQEARFGNPLPRIAESASGMLNAVGLQNPGVDRVIAEELPKLAKVSHKGMIANVAGFSLAEYVNVAQKLDAQEQIAAIELNISCPNVHSGGMEFGVHPETAKAVTAAVKAVVHKPLIVKLTPNVTDIVAMAQAAVDGGADALTLINTVKAMRIDLKKRAPLLANGTGGLSGPAIFPIALRMVFDVFAATDVPIIGCGGIQTAEDVVEMMMAGASAVQIGAVGLSRPDMWDTLLADLEGMPDRLGVEQLSDIIGVAHATADKKKKSNKNTTNQRKDEQ